MMLLLDPPAALHGDALEAELADAGFDVQVSLARGRLRIVGTDAQERVREVVDAHVPPDRLPDPDVALADAVEAATNVAELKAALLGENGLGRAAGRRP